MLSMLDRHAVQELLRAGLPVRAVARQLGISRRSVRRIQREPPVRSPARSAARKRAGPRAARRAPYSGRSGGAPSTGRRAQGNRRRPGASCRG